MSDDVDQDERQFDPSPHKLEQARREGNVPKSKEIGSAATLLAGAALLVFGGEHLMERVLATSRETFAQLATGVDDFGQAGMLIRSASIDIGLAMAPILVGAMAVGIFATMIQTGFLFLPELILPKSDRLNPMKQLGQLFAIGPASVRTLEGVAKTVFVALAVYWVAKDEIDAIDRAGTGEVSATALHLAAAAARVLLAGSGALILIAAADYAYQRFNFMKQMRMTREEMKQEAKEMDGSPEIKQKRKAMYRDLSLNRVLKEVPQATVILANPTHVSVALRYEPGVDTAPRVVAKGTDEVALTIRRIAREHGVPIVECPALARALNRKVKIGRRITEDFYQAVAEILTQVYRMKNRK